jgi:hypothetical protein
MGPKRQPVSKQSDTGATDPFRIPDLSLQERSRLAEEELAKIEAERKANDHTITRRPLEPLPNVDLFFRDPQLLTPER